MDYKQSVTEYPESFRKQVALEVIGGIMTVYQARKTYSIGGKMTVYNWVMQYKQFGVCTLSLAEQKLIAPMPKKPKTDKQPERDESVFSEQRIKQLERQLEDERLLKEMYRRMITIAEQEHKIGNPRNERQIPA
jgi:transposase-like protein